MITCHLHQHDIQKQVVSGSNPSPDILTGGPRGPMKPGTPGLPVSPLFPLGPLGQKTENSPAALSPAPLFQSVHVQIQRNWEISLKQQGSPGWHGKEEQSHLEKQIANTTLALLMGYVGSLGKDEKEVTIREVPGGMFMALPALRDFCDAEWKCCDGQQQGNSAGGHTAHTWEPRRLLNCSFAFISRFNWKNVCLVLISCDTLPNYPFFLTDQGSLNGSWWTEPFHVHF